RLLRERRRRQVLLDWARHLRRGRGGQPARRAAVRGLHSRPQPPLRGCTATPKRRPCASRRRCPGGARRCWGRAFRWRQCLQQGEAMTSPALVAPIPVPDPDSAPYWEGLKNGSLMLCRCDDTGKWIHPPLERSRYTGGPVHFEEVSGNGTIFSYIVVRQALVPGRVPPYVVGLVELV